MFDCGLVKPFEQSDMVGTVKPRKDLDASHGRFDASGLGAIDVRVVAKGGEQEPADIKGPLDEADPEGIW